MSLESAIQHLLNAKRISAASQSYRKDNPNEYAKVKAYLDGGARPTGVVTEMGIGLIEVEDERRNVTPPPPPPPPPPMGTPIPTNGVISAGGTYSGAFTGTVRIQTTAPVTISQAQLTNLSGGDLIDAVGTGPVQVTLDRVTATGGQSYQTSGRFFQAYGFKSLVCRNCSIENTRGIDLAVGAAGATALVTRNRHRNIQSNDHDPFVVGNFVQLRVMTFASCEISWNEIINEYNKSEPHDIVSLYHVRNVDVLDNYFQHQSRMGNATPSSQGGITIDSSDAGPGVHDCRVRRNQVVDGYGIVASVQSGASNILIENNRLVADRYLPNGQLKANGKGSPLTITPGGSNNHAHGNIVGYIDADGTYISQAVLAQYLSGAAEGGTAEAANNTIMAQADITVGAEQAEWTFWQQKVQAAGATIGA